MAPFKMKGFSPFHQEEKKMMKTAGKKVTPQKTEEKFRLARKTDAKTGKMTHYKISGGSATDGGKTFAPTVETKISESEYNSLKGN